MNELPTLDQLLAMNKDESEKTPTEEMLDSIPYDSDRKVYIISNDIVAAGQLVDMALALRPKMEGKIVAVSLNSLTIFDGKQVNSDEIFLDPYLKCPADKAEIISNLLGKNFHVDPTGLRDTVTMTADRIMTHKKINFFTKIWDKITTLWIK